ncbi:hypothetical protein ACGFJT_29985 [Actinomadura geliboluensis]|uniref:hypothetical protein n=1 Tax=Actinomadura geliboluensis TaxID=882440 RepID=UPI0037101EBA
MTEQPQNEDDAVIDAGDRAQHGTGDRPEPIEVAATPPGRTRCRTVSGTAAPRRSLRRIPRRPGVRPTDQPTWDELDDEDWGPDSTRR